MAVTETHIRTTLSRRRYLRSEGGLALLFMLPALVFLGLIVIYPLVNTVYTSFFSSSLVRPQARGFAGMHNYYTLLSDAGFWRTLGRTLLWTIGSVIGKTLLGLCLALLLCQPFRGNRIYRFLILVPWATPQVIGAVIWKWTLDGQYGYLNYLLMSLGFIGERVSFLGDPTGAFLSAMAVDMWFGIPFMTMVLLAGLQAIPQELYDAAAVDGAQGIRRFGYVTMPLLLPIFTVATSLSVIWTFNSFNIIQTMTGGGPVGATEILVIRTYKEAFGRYDVGISSAYAVVILIILMLFSVSYWRLLRRRGDTR